MLQIRGPGRAGRALGDSPAQVSELVHGLCTLSDERVPLGRCQQNVVTWFSFHPFISMLCHRAL